MAENTNVVRSCEKYINLSAYSGACNKFVSAVARDFGISIDGTANDIFTFLRSRAGVKHYGCGELAEHLASADALHGRYLVIAASYDPTPATKDHTPHGHVAIVVGPGHGGSVNAYAGALPAQGKKATPNVGGRITSRQGGWAHRKITDPYVSAEYVEFHGVPIPTPFIAGDVPSAP